MSQAPVNDLVLDKDNKLVRAWRMWFSFADRVIQALQYTPTTVYSVPLTGFTIQAASNASKLVLNPAGVLATGTVTMPATPQEGFEFRLSSTQVVTALTLTPGPGQTIKNAATALAAGAGICYTYASSTSTWYRLY